MPEPPPCTYLLGMDSTKPDEETSEEAELNAARRLRRERDHAAPMSERLQRLDSLCKQLTKTRVGSPDESPSS